MNDEGNYIAVLIVRFLNVFFFFFADLKGGLTLYTFEVMNINVSSSLQLSPFVHLNVEVKLQFNMIESPIKADRNKCFIKVELEYSIKCATKIMINH